MTSSNSREERARSSAVAVLRLGLGARPGELAAVADDPRSWLHDQVCAGGSAQPAAPLPSSAEALDQVFSQDSGSGQDGVAADRLARAEAQARVALGVATPAGFQERWALFWANHFTVIANGAPAFGGAGAFEREAIRPNVFRRFEDLSLAALRHPVLLLSYEQGNSAGPASEAVRRFGGGMSENLGRESLELHILGRDAGYRQADVRQMSLALTGWSTTTEPQPVSFLFRPELHEPGSRTVLGRRYDQPGELQCEAIVREICRGPEAARHIADRLAKHFVQDHPPASLVDRLAGVHMQSQGSLAAVAHALIDAPETWALDASKFKTPQELYISAGRALGRQPPSAADACAAMEQPFFMPPSPAGWPDHATAWISPSALAKRAAWLQTLELGELQNGALLRLAETALGPRLRPATLPAIYGSGADLPQTLLFLSPEFQRR